MAKSDKMSYSGNQSQQWLIEMLQKQVESLERINEGLYHQLEVKDKQLDAKDRQLDAKDKQIAWGLESLEVALQQLREYEMYDEPLVIEPKTYLPPLSRFGPWDEILKAKLIAERASSSKEEGVTQNAK